MRAAGLLLCAALAALVLVALAVPAVALEPGVHADPGSPAEKEYVLPLEHARGTGGKGSSPSSSSPHLFGSGITPPRGGSGGSGGSGVGGSHAGTGTGKTGATARGGGDSKGSARGSTGSISADGEGARLPDAVLRASRSRGSSGNGSLFALIGGGLAILVVGAFGGTVLRHSRRPTRPTPSR